MNNLLNIFLQSTNPSLNIFRIALHLLYLVCTISLSGNALATNVDDEANNQKQLEQLSNPDLHCGTTPPKEVLEGIIRALSEPNEQKEATKPSGLKNKELQLLMHFPSGATELPSDCAKKLKNLARLTKKRKIRSILIRSSLNDEHATEFDLALASERLENIKILMHKERLARKAMILELHPSTNNPMISESFYTPRIIEIYSLSD